MSSNYFPIWGAFFFNIKIIIIFANPKQQSERMSSTATYKRKKIEEGKQSHINVKVGLQEMCTLKNSDITRMAAAASVKNTVVPTHYTS